MNRMIYDEKNMCFRSMTDDEVILSRIKEGKGLEPLQTPKNKRGKSMRAIDADTLKKTLRDWIRDYWTDAFTGDDAGSEFADMIDHAETIEQLPIVHARWIDPKHGVYKCSNCGHYLDFRGVNAGRGDANYCPNCGAKMDKEEDE